MYYYYTVIRCYKYINIEFQTISQFICEYYYQHIPLKESPQDFWIMKWSTGGMWLGMAIKHPIFPNGMWKFPTLHHGFVERGCLVWTGDGIWWDYLWQWSLEASSNLNILSRMKIPSLNEWNWNEHQPYIHNKHEQACWARGMRDTSCRAIHTQLAWCGLSLCQPCDCRWRTNN